MRSGMRSSTKAKAAGSRKIRVLMADDDPIVRDLLRKILTAENDIDLCGEATDGSEALRLVQKLRPDILLLDLLMPNLPGMEALREMSASAAPVPTVVLSASISTPQVVEALQMGARGLVQKDSLPQLVPAIRTVLAGGLWVRGRKMESALQVLDELMASSELPPSPSRFGLTSREMEVTSLVAQGCSNRDISQKLSISEATVKRHLTNVFNKVGMSTRLELALFAIDHRLVSRT